MEINDTGNRQSIAQLPPQKLLNRNPNPRYPQGGLEGRNRPLAPAARSEKRGLAINELPAQFEAWKKGHPEETPITVQQLSPASLVRYAEYLEKGFRGISGSATTVDTLMAGVQTSSESDVIREAESAQADITLVQVHGSYSEKPVAAGKFPGKVVVLIHRPEEFLDRNKTKAERDQFLAGADALVLLGPASLETYQQLYPDKVVTTIPHGFFEMGTIDYSRLDPGSIATVGSITTWDMKDMRHIPDALKLIAEVKAKGTGLNVLGYLGHPAGSKAKDNLEEYRGREDVWLLSNAELEQLIEDHDVKDAAGFQRMIYAESMKTGKSRTIIRTESASKGSSLAEWETGLIDFNLQLYREVTKGGTAKVEYSGTLHLMGVPAIYVVLDSPAMNDVATNEGLGILQVPIDGTAINYSAGAEKILSMIRDPAGRRTMLEKNRDVASKLGMDTIAFAYDRLFRELLADRAEMRIFNLPFFNRWQTKEDQLRLFAANDLRKVFQIVKQAYSGLPDSYEKDNLHVVTVADHLVQLLLVLELQQLFPDDYFLGEEKIDLDYLQDQFSELAKIDRPQLQKTFGQELVRFKQLKADHENRATQKSVAARWSIEDVLDGKSHLNPLNFVINDPMDGTSNFKKGSLMYGFSLARTTWNPATDLHEPSYSITYAPEYTLTLRDGRTIYGPMLEYNQREDRVSLYGTLPKSAFMQILHKLLYGVLPHGTFGLIIRNLKLTPPLSRKENIVVLRDSKSEGPNPHLGPLQAGFQDYQTSDKWDSSVVGIMETILGNLAVYGGIMKLWDHAGSLGLVRAMGGIIFRIDEHGYGKELLGYTDDDIKRGYQDELFPVVVVFGERNIQNFRKVLEQVRFFAYAGGTDPETKKTKDSSNTVIVTVPDPNAGLANRATVWDGKTKKPVARISFEGVFPSAEEVTGIQTSQNGRWVFLTTRNSVATFDLKKIETTEESKFDLIAPGHQGDPQRAIDQWLGMQSDGVTHSEMARFFIALRTSATRTEARATLIKVAYGAAVLASIVAIVWALPIPAMLAARVYYGSSGVFAALLIAPFIGAYWQMNQHTDAKATLMRVAYGAAIVASIAAIVWALPLPGMLPARVFYGGLGVIVALLIAPFIRAHRKMNQKSRSHESLPAAPRGSGPIILHGETHGATLKLGSKKPSLFLQNSLGIRVTDQGETYGYDILGNHALLGKVRAEGSVNKTFLKTEFWNVARGKSGEMLQIKLLPASTGKVDFVYRVIARADDQSGVLPDVDRPWFNPKNVSTTLGGLEAAQNRAYVTGLGILSLIAGFKSHPNDLIFFKEWVSPLVSNWAQVRELFQPGLTLANIDVLLTPPEEKTPSEFDLTQAHRSLVDQIGQLQLRAETRLASAMGFIRSAGSGVLVLAAVLITSACKKGTPNTPAEKSEILQTAAPAQNPPQSGFRPIAEDPGVLLTTPAGVVLTFHKLKPAYDEAVANGDLQKIKELGISALGTVVSIDKLTPKSGVAAEIADGVALRMLSTKKGGKATADQPFAGFLRLLQERLPELTNEDSGVLLKLPNGVVLTFRDLMQAYDEAVKKSDLSKIEAIATEILATAAQIGQFKPKPRLANAVAKGAAQWMLGKENGGMAPANQPFAKLLLAIEDKLPELASENSVVSLKTPKGDVLDFSNLKPAYDEAVKKTDLPKIEAIAAEILQTAANKDRLPTKPKDVEAKAKGVAKWMLDKKRGGMAPDDQPIEELVRSIEEILHELARSETRTKRRDFLKAATSALAFNLGTGLGLNAAEPDTKSPVDDEQARANLLKGVRAELERMMKEKSFKGNDITYSTYWVRNMNRTILGHHWTEILEPMIQYAMVPLKVEKIISPEDFAGRAGKFLSLLEKHKNAFSAGVLAELDRMENEKTFRGNDFLTDGYWSRNTGREISDADWKRALEPMLRDTMKQLKGKQVIEPAEFAKKAKEYVKQNPGILNPPRSETRLRISPEMIQKGREAMSLTLQSVGYAMLVASVLVFGLSALYIRFSILGDPRALPILAASFITFLFLFFFLENFPERATTPSTRMKWLVAGATALILSLGAWGVYEARDFIMQQLPAIQNVPESNSLEDLPFIQPPRSEKRTNSLTRHESSDPSRRSEIKGWIVLLSFGLTVLGPLVLWIYSMYAEDQREIARVEQVVGHPWNGWKTHGGGALYAIEAVDDSLGVEGRPDWLLIFEGNQIYRLPVPKTLNPAFGRSRSDFPTRDRGLLLTLAGNFLLSELKSESQPVTPDMMKPMPYNSVTRFRIGNPEDDIRAFHARYDSASAVTVNGRTVLRIGNRSESVNIAPQSALGLLGAIQKLQLQGNLPWDLRVEFLGMDSVYFSIHDQSSNDTEASFEPRSLFPKHSGGVQVTDYARLAQALTASLQESPEGQAALKAQASKLQAQRKAHILSLKKGVQGDAIEQVGLKPGDHVYGYFPEELSPDGSSIIPEGYHHLVISFISEISQGLTWTHVPSAYDPIRDSQTKPDPDHPKRIIATVHFVDADGRELQSSDVSIDEMKKQNVIVVRSEKRADFAPEAWIAPKALSLTETMEREGTSLPGIATTVREVTKGLYATWVIAKAKAVAKLLSLAMPERAGIISEDLEKKLTNIAQGALGLVGKQAPTASDVLVLTRDLWRKDPDLKVPAGMRRAYPGQMILLICRNDGDLAQVAELNLRLEKAGIRQPVNAVLENDHAEFVRLVGKQSSIKALFYGDGNAKVPAVLLLEKYEQVNVLPGMLKRFLAAMSELVSYITNGLAASFATAHSA